MKSITFSTISSTNCIILFSLVLSFYKNFMVLIYKFILKIFNKDFAESKLTDFNHFFCPTLVYNLKSKPEACFIKLKIQLFA